ncbi:MAG: segregation/condensation protein A [Patescibacteria group bacterium]
MGPIFSFVMAYHIRLSQFEGPLDLLLSLIEKEKLDITKVSLATVADQYLEYIKNEEAISLENLSSFLSVATRLILIKSRALLPILEWSEEEEESIEDLENQLRIYKYFREASQKLGALFAKNTQVAGRESYLGMQAVYYPPKDISAETLRQCYLDILGDIPIIQELPEKELHSIITLEEKMRQFQETLSERVEHSFFEMTKNVGDRVEIIVSFLAVLELVKQRYIFVEQQKFFSDIHITRLT